MDQIECEADNENSPEMLHALYLNVDEHDDSSDKFHPSPLSLDHYNRDLRYEISIYSWFQYNLLQ